jgi:hypothetical protein
LDSIDNRIEVMVSQFITTGRIPIVGLGVKREIDYKIPNMEALTGADRWGQPGVNILASMRRKVDELAHLGHSVDEVFMSPEVWTVVYQDAMIQKLLDNTRYEFGHFAPEKESKYGAARRVGVLSDPFVPLYTQMAEYGPKGDRRRYLPAGMVIFGTQEARQNKLGYGAVTIMDENENWVTVSGRYVQQFFKERKPPREEVLVTSRVVPIPKNTESWSVFQVL